MTFVRCSRCGQISIDNEWSGTMKLMVCGRTYHLCEECCSEVLSYIFEGAELGMDKEENDEGV